MKLSHKIKELKKDLKQVCEMSDEISDGLQRCLEHAKSIEEIEAAQKTEGRDILIVFDGYNQREAGKVIELPDQTHIMVKGKPFWANVQEELIESRALIATIYAEPEAADECAPEMIYASIRTLIDQHNKKFGIEI